MQLELAPAMKEVQEEGKENSWNIKWVSQGGRGAGSEMGSFFFIGFLLAVELTANLLT